MKYKLNEEQFNKLCEKFISSTFEDVLAGKADNDSILYFIGEVASMIIRKQPLPDSYRIALARVLCDIAEGKDPAKAFGLKSGHRRKNDASHQRSIALHVWTFINTHNYSVKKAILTVAEEPYWKTKANSIKQYYCEFKDEIDAEAKEILNL